MKYLTATVRGLPAGTTARQVEDNFNLSISENPCVVGPIVEELQGGSCSTTVTFQKESKGKKRDPEELIKAFHRTQFGGRQSTISVSDSFSGLNALAGRGDAPCHIYFVHGICGHAFRTWSSDVREGDIKTLKAWPRDFLPKRLLKEKINARVYSLGYNANVLRKAAPNATIISAAEDLLAALRGDRADDPPREIYFVCHSLGGIVVSQALSMALFVDEDCPNKDQYRNLFIHRDRCLVKGVVLMGTPLRGSGQANLLAPLVRTIKGLNRFSASNDYYIKALRENDDSLDIPKIVQRFKSVINDNNIALLIACEETPFVGSSLTTSYESAVATLGDVATPFRIRESDHLSMVKFEDENETEYKQLENLIIKMIKEAQSNHRSGQPQAINSSPSPPTGLSYPQIHDNNVNSNPTRDSSGIIVNITMGANQTMPAYPSRQHTEPLPYRHAPEPHSNRHSDHVADHSVNHGQSQAFRRTQTEHFPNSLKDGTPFSRLGLFDTALIIDDTGSMVVEARAAEPDGPDRWTVTKQAAEHIAQIAAEHDRDGIEIRFLMSSHLRGNNITSGQAVNDKLSQINLFDGTHQGGTYFKACLEELIGPRIYQYQFYKEDLDQYPVALRRALRDRTPKPEMPTPPKPYNLIVITDGAANDRQEVEEYIVQIATTLDTLGAPKRQIGIQFVQVGEDLDAKQWLEVLDDDLAKRDPPIRDIVDTTPFDSHLIQSNTSFTEAIEQVLVEKVLRKALLGGVTEDEDARKNNAILAELAS